MGANHFITSTELDELSLLLKFMLECNERIDTPAILGGRGEPEKSLHIKLIINNIIANPAFKMHFVRVGGLGFTDFDLITFFSSLDTFFKPWTCCRTVDRAGRCVVRRAQRRHL